MFTRVGRHLAILNTVTVILLIALVGAITFVALRHSLNQEMDRALSERIESHQIPATGDDFTTSGSATAAMEVLPPAIVEGTAAEEIISSGDTILFVFNAERQVIENPRQIRAPGLPVRESLEVTLQGETDVRSLTLPDGEPVRVMTVPVFSQGEVVGAVQGVRSRHELNEQLGTLRWVILVGVGLGVVVSAPAGYYLSRRAMKPINAAFDRQRQFVADASHELRTPITLIRANAELAMLEAGESRNESEPQIKSVLREVDHINRLIGDLLLMAQLDSGQLHLNIERQDLVSVVRYAVAGMGPLFTERGIQPEFEASAEAFVEADQGRITQAVRILLDNALKHTPPGGRVTTAVGVEGNDAVITVSDTGEGIADEHLERIFDRFFRVDRARSRASGGTGLGLPIARGIVEIHGGSLHLDSRPGSGTRATIRLPMEQREARASERHWTRAWRRLTTGQGSA